MYIECVIERERERERECDTSVGLVFEKRERDLRSRICSRGLDHVFTFLHIHTLSLALSHQYSVLRYSTK